MRSDDLYLSDIVQAASSIARFVEGLDEDRFRSHASQERETHESPMFP